MTLLQASDEILNLIKSQVPNLQIEKASIDEVFIDLTPLIVIPEIHSTIRSHSQESEIKDSLTQSAHGLDQIQEHSVVVGGPIDYTNDEHLALLAGWFVFLKLFYGLS